MDRLTPFQRELLQAFFRRDRDFFLTGGAALAGFHLGHRETLDLDLFTLGDRLDEAEQTLAETAAEIGASVERVQTAPEFRRRLVTRGAQNVLVDMVRERTPQGVTDKPVIDGVRVDPPLEIFANKLCALLSRGEIRDLVDAQHLERAGHSFERAFELAQRKDGGLSPAQLAWVLGEIRIGDDARIPGGSPPSELRAYIASLRERLERASFPR